MSDASIERLLQPSLDHAQAPARAPYSASAQFLTGFFGGPLAVLFCFGASVHRLDRWREDAWFLAVLAVALFGAVYLPQTPFGAPVRHWWLDLLGSGAMRIWTTLWTSVAALVAIRRHRRQRRAADLMGLSVERPFLSCALIVVAAIIGSFVVSAAIKGLI